MRGPRLCNWWAGLLGLAVIVNTAGIANAQGINPTGRALLGQIWLEILGSSGQYQRELDCQSFGVNFVLVGIDGKHGQAVDGIRLICAEVLSGGTVSTKRRMTQFYGQDVSGAAFERVCPSQNVVTGIEAELFAGTSDRFNLYPKVRGVRLKCSRLYASGLTTPRLVDQIAQTAPASSWLLLAGGTGNSAKKKVECTDGRSARSIKLDYGPFDHITYVWVYGNLSVGTLKGWTLSCQQPRVPSS